MSPSARQFLNCKQTPPLPMPPISSFHPALVPSGARPHVLEAIDLVRGFVTKFFTIGMLLVTLIAILLGWLPGQVDEFGPLIQGLLAVVFAAIFLSVVFVFNMKRIDCLFRTQHLSDLCRGDAGSAASLAFDVACDASTATLGAALRIMDAVKDTPPTQASNAIHQAGAPLPSHAGKGMGIIAGEQVQEAAGHRESGRFVSAAPSMSRQMADEEQPLLEQAVDNAMHKLHGLMDKDLPGKFRAAAAEETLETVKSAMEEDPLYIYEKGIRLLLKDTLYVVVASPLGCLFGGYCLCKFDVNLRAGELTMIGLVIGTVGPIVWHSVRAQALQHLERAQGRMDELGLDVIEDRKVEELVAQQGRVRAAEMQRLREMALVAEKEDELRRLQAARPGRRVEQKPEDSGLLGSIFGGSTDGGSPWGGEDMV